jgi:hypothetical protein
MSSSKRSYQVAMGGHAGSDVKPDPAPAKVFSQCSLPYSEHQFWFLGDLFSMWASQTKKFTFPSGISVQVIVCKEDEKPMPRLGRVGTSMGLSFGASKWDGGEEKNRLEVRFVAGCPTNVDWGVTVDMWGTPVEGGDKVHLRTLIDTQDAVPVRDNIGWVVTKYFTISKEETEQNAGSDNPGIFHFTCVMKGTKKD